MFTFLSEVRPVRDGCGGTAVFLTWLFLEKTRYGAIMRAGIENKEIGVALGIDIHLLFTVASRWAYLAGIGGRADGADSGPVARHGRGHARIAFVVVALGGLGNLLGAIAAGLLIGRRAGDRRGLLDGGLHRGDLRGDGRRSPGAAARLVRHQMKKQNCPAAGGRGRAAARLRPAIASGDLDLRDPRLGLNLLLGYTGLLSFGQATFFGSAAYVAGGCSSTTASTSSSRWARACFVGAASAAAVGYLCVQRSGLLFHHAHLRAEPAFYFVAYQWTSVDRRRGRDARLSRGPRSSASTSAIPRLLRLRVGAVPRLALDHEAHRGIAPGERSCRRSARTRCAPRPWATTWRVSSFAAFVIGGAFSGLAGVLYAMLFGIRAAGSHRLRHLGQRRLRHPDRRLGIALRPVIGSFVFIWLSSLSAPCGRAGRSARRGLRDRGALPARGASKPGPGYGILETKTLSKAFGALTAVDEVSLGIEAGTLHSIIGRTARGRPPSSIFSPGTYRPSSGRILFDGRDITGTPAHRVAHLGLARSFQRTNVFPAFSLLDNVWSRPSPAAPRGRDSRGGGRIAIPR